MKIAALDTARKQPARTMARTVGIGAMLQDEIDDAGRRLVDRAILAAAAVSFGFGLAAMLAGLLG